MSSAIDYVRNNCGIAGEEVANYVDALESQIARDTALIEQLRSEVGNAKSSGWEDCETGKEMDEEAMSNADLIEQAREAIDNMDDFARMANVVATGPLLVLNRSIDALEAADKRIAELEKYGRVQDPLADRIAELERKLAVAREALKQIPHALGHDFYAAATTIADEALAQIGGEDASS